MYFYLPDDVFSLMPKQIAGNEIKKKLVVTNGLYFPFGVYVPQRHVIDKETV
jgi:hypothetical protein